MYSLLYGNGSVNTGLLIQSLMWLTMAKTGIADHTQQSIIYKMCLIDVQGL